MKKCLPRNLICLDLLVGPFFLEHPREVYIFSPYLPTTEQVLHTVCGFLTTGPMVPLAPFCPTNPICPCSPIGPVSPRCPCWPWRPWREVINEQVCCECTNFVLSLLFTTTIQAIVQGSKLTVIQEQKVYFSPKQVNWQTFSPGFPLSPILPGLPSWPW